MCKVSKIISIIIASMLIITQLIRFLPQNSLVQYWLNCFLEQIKNSPFMNTFFSALVIFSCFIIAVGMVHNLKEEKKRHSFKVGSKAFCSFFAKWYSQPGVLSIFCDDLEGWVNPEGNNAILDALKIKSRKNELRLFLVRESPVAIISELRDLNAAIKCVPLGIISNYSFSCLSIMGNHSAVIVRDKQKDKSTNIIFEEISDSYISGLLNTIIREGIFDEER